MRVGLFIMLLGVIFITIGYLGQTNPQCKDEVQVRIVPRNVYDEIIASSEIPRNLF